MFYQQSTPSCGFLFIFLFLPSIPHPTRSLAKKKAVAKIKSQVYIDNAQRRDKLLRCARTTVISTGDSAVGTSRDE